MRGDVTFVLSESLYKSVPGKKKTLKNPNRSVPVVISPVDLKLFSRTKPKKVQVLSEDHVMLTLREYKLTFMRPKSPE